MNTRLVAALIASQLLTGCYALNAINNSMHHQPGTPYQSDWVPAVSSRTLANPAFKADFEGCQKLAASQPYSAAMNDGLIGAGLGAGIGALAAMALGADVGDVAMMGALGGGVRGISSTASANEQRYREILVSCLRDKRHEVY